MTTKTILVTGATGKTGSRIIHKLEARGCLVRAGSRSAAIPFDWQDRDTWRPVLTDIKAVYICYYPDFAFPGALDNLQAFVENAMQAGVERFVMITGRGEEHALRAEALVRSSGVDTTILRCAWFAQNFSEGYLHDAVMGDVVPMPGGDVSEPMVDLDDVADVAVAALTEDGHWDQVYELTGPRLMTFEEIAGVLTAATGRTISYVPISFDDFHAELEAAAGSIYADIVTDIARDTFDGRNAYVGDGIERVLGRAPRDFTLFAAQAAQAGTWSLADR